MSEPYIPTPQSKRVADQKKKRAVEKPDDEPVQFKGLPDYVEEAADSAGLDDPELRTKALAGWHASAVNLALSQLVEQAKDGRLSQFPEGTVDEVFERVHGVLASLDVQREALAAAVADAKAIVGEPEKMARSNADDRKPLNAARLAKGRSDDSQPGAHRPDRPSPPAPKVKATKDDARAEAESSVGEEAKPVKRGRKAERPTERPDRSPQGAPVDPPVDARRPNLPPADIDGDGDEEVIPDPGSVDAPNYPTPEGDVEGDGQDDKDAEKAE